MPPLSLWSLRLKCALGAVATLCGVAAYRADTGRAKPERSAACAVLLLLLSWWCGVLSWLGEWFPEEAEGKPEESDEVKALWEQLAALRLGTPEAAGCAAYEADRAAGVPVGGERDAQRGRGAGQGRNAEGSRPEDRQEPDLLMYDSELSQGSEEDDAPNGITVSYLWDGLGGPRTRKHIYVGVRGRIIIGDLEDTIRNAWDPEPAGGLYRMYREDGRSRRGGHRLPRTEAVGAGERLWLTIVTRRTGAAGAARLEAGDDGDIEGPEGVQPRGQQGPDTSTRVARGSVATFPFCDDCQVILLLQRQTPLVRRPAEPEKSLRSEF